MNKSDFDNQVKQWENAARSGDAKASLLLGNHFHDIGDADSAFHWYMDAAKQKDVNPMVFFYLGYAYQHGQGTPIDMMEAFVMYRKAAASDIPQALYSLAYFYQNGIVVPKNETTAVAYMKQATQKMDALYFMQCDAHAELEQLRTQAILQKEAAASLFHQNEKILRENGQLSEQIVHAKQQISESIKEKEAAVRQAKTAGQQFQTQKEELTDRYEKQLSALRKQTADLQDRLQEMSSHETGLWKEIDRRDQDIQLHLKKTREYENQISQANLQLSQCTHALESSRTDVEKLTRAIFKMTYWIDRNLSVEITGQSPSVFSKFSFTVDGIHCMSMESFLQSLKFKNAEKQKSVCDMPPAQARKLGTRKNWWKRTGNLWWKGNKIKRSGSEYQALLDRVFSELYQNSEFKNMLMDCGNIEILHPADDHHAQEVILSEDEFVSRLVGLRKLR